MTSLNIAKKESTYFGKTSKGFEPDEVMQRTEEHFSTMRRVDLKYFQMSADGIVNGEFYFTPNGIKAFCRAFGIQFSTMNYLYSLDRDHCASCLRDVAYTRTKDSKLHLLIHEGDKIEGVVTPKYVHFPTVDLIDSFLKNNKEQKIVSIEFEGMRSRFKSLDDQEVIAPRKDDILKVGRDLINSEDGSRAFDFSILIYRLACENGMILPNRYMEKRIIHMGKNSLERAKDSLRSTLFNSNEILELLTKAIAMELTATKIDKLMLFLERRVSKLFATRVLLEYENSVMEGQGKNLYDFWNALTHISKSMGERQRDLEKLAYNIL